MATDQRANALMYNLGIEDDTDIFLFPHLADQYTGLYFDAPPTYTDAFGGAVFKVGNAHLGIFLNRPTDRALDRYRMQVTSNAPFIRDRFQGGDKPTPNNNGQTFSRNSGHPILFLSDFGDMALSARIRMWPGTSGISGDGDTIDPSQFSEEERNQFLRSENEELFDQVLAPLTQESSNQESNGAVGVDLGFSWELNKDTDATVNVGHVSYVDVGAETNLDFTARNWGKGNTVLIGAFQVGLWSPDAGDGDYFVGAPVKYGWVFNEDEGRLKAAVLTGLDLQVTQRGGGDSNTGVGLPIVEMAAEYRVTDWMFIRSGVKGGFGLKLTGNKGYSDLPKMTHYEQTEFNSGVGFAWRQFRADAAVSYAALTSGPHFIGGQSSGPLFGGISLAYLFGADTNMGHSEPMKTAPSTPRPKAVAPAPAPAPIQKKPTPVKTVDDELKEMRKKVELEKLRSEMRRLQSDGEDSTPGGAAPTPTPTP
jgi:hypothetical protein